MPIIVEDINGLYLNENLSAQTWLPQLYALQSELDNFFKIERYPISDAFLRAEADASRLQAQHICEKHKLTHLTVEKVNNSQKKLMQALWRRLPIKNLTEWYNQAKALFQAQKEDEVKQIEFIKSYFSAALLASMHMSSAIDAFKLLTNAENADFSRDPSAVKEQLEASFADDYDLEKDEQNLQVCKLKQWLRHMARLTPALFKLQAWRGQENVSDVLLISNKEEYQVNAARKLKPSTDPVETFIKTYLSFTNAYDLLRQLIVNNADAQFINHPALQEVLALYFQQKHQVEVSLSSVQQNLSQNNFCLNNIKAFNAALNALRFVVDGKGYRLYVDASFIKWDENSNTLDINAFYVEKADGLKYLYTYYAQQNEYVEGQWQTSTLMPGMRIAYDNSQGKVSIANLPRNMVFLDVETPVWNTEENVASSTIEQAKQDMLCLDLYDDLNSYRTAKSQFGHDYIENQLLRMLEQPSEAYERVLLLQLLFALQRGAKSLGNNTKDLRLIEKQFPYYFPSRIRTFDGNEVDTKVQFFCFILSAMNLAFFAASLLYKPNVKDGFLSDFTSPQFYGYLLYDTLPSVNALFFFTLQTVVCCALVFLGRLTSDILALYDYFFSYKTAKTANFSKHMQEGLPVNHALAELYGSFARISDLHKPRDLFHANLGSILATPFSTVRLIGAKEFRLRTVLNYSVWPLAGYAIWLATQVAKAERNLSRPDIAEAESPFLKKMATQGVRYFNAFYPVCHNSTEGEKCEVGIHEGLTLLQSLFLLSGLLALNVQWFFLIPDLFLQAKRKITAGFSATTGFFSEGLSIFRQHNIQEDNERRGLLQNP